MDADKTTRPCKAVYDVTYYDFDWNEIADMRRVRCTAHEMAMCIESFNQHHQRVARDPAVIITPYPHPMSIAIEVNYV